MTIYDSLKLKFDKNGKKIEEDRHVICGAGFIHVTTQYEYGESGKLSRSKAFCGGSVFESEYRYDEKGRLIKIETLQDGKYSGTTYYDYDKRGNLIDISKYGKHPSIEKYGYDSKGQLKKKTYEYGESLNTYEYDENGNIAREIHKEYGEVKRTFEYRRKYKS